MKPLFALFVVLGLMFASTAQADIIMDPPGTRYGPSRTPGYRPRRPAVEPPAPVVPEPAPQKDSIDEIIDDAEKDDAMIIDDAERVGLLPGLVFLAVGIAVVAVAIKGRDGASTRSA